MLDYALFAIGLLVMAWCAVQVVDIRRQHKPMDERERLILEFDLAMLNATTPEERHRLRARLDQDLHRLNNP